MKRGSSGIAALLAREGGGLAKVSGVGESDVGCELADDLVADAKTRIEIGESRAAPHDSDTAGLARCISLTI
jgi:hypothetical protein